MPDDAVSLYGILYLVNVNASLRDFKHCVGNL